MIRKGAKWYVGSWLGGFEWRIFVGVDGVLHAGRRAANVGGRSGVVYVERCVILWLSRQVFSVRLRKRCGGVRGR